MRTLEEVKEIKKRYQELLSAPQLHVNGMTVQVSTPWWKYVEIRASFGVGIGETCCGSSECEIFLTAEEVDKLIERLQIAKEALLEMQNNNKTWEEAFVEK